MKKGNNNITESHASVNIDDFDETFPEQQNGVLDQFFKETASHSENVKEDPVDKNHQDEKSSELKVDSKLPTSNSVPEHGKSSVSSVFPVKALSWSDLGRCMLKKANGLAAVDLLLEFLEEIEDNKESLDPLLLNAFYADFRILMEQE